MVKKLPKGWEEAELAELVPLPKQAIVDGPFGSNLKASEYQEKGIPIIRLQNIDRNLFINKNIKFITAKKAKELQRHNFKSGDIAVTKLGAPLGKAAIIPKEMGEGIIVADVVRVRTDEKFVDKKYLTYGINSPSVTQSLARETKGTTRPRVNLKHIRELKIPTAPLNEQKRIVDKIERLFSDLDEGEAQIKQVQKQLATYRQSVLKAAVTGELTKDWRKRNKHKLEPGEKLLERILKSRRDNWEGTGKYKEPEFPDVQGLHNIPSEWTWGTLPQLGEFGRGKSKHRPRNDPKLYENGVYPFLQTGTVRASSGRINTYDKKYNELGLKQSKLWPIGTVCITIAANIAESGILEIEACFPDSVVGLVAGDGVSAKYIEFFIRTAKQNLDAYAPATAQKNINLEILGKVAIPLPSFEEQEEIVDLVSDIFSQIDAMEKWCEEGLRRSATLRQSILKAAFSGKLVPQDPADEPASELLKRIQATQNNNHQKKGKAA